MSLQSRRRALLVTGMHRSGTSCVTRVVNLTGLAIGTDLLPSRADNPAGFWEHAGLGAINEEILERLGTSWDALAPLPEDACARPELDDARARLAEIIRHDFADETDIVIKDPRICLLAPLWRDALTELGFEVEFLFVLRNVEAVVASLHARHAFAPWQSELLWLRYNLAFEAETRDDRRALVHYEDLLEDWRTALGKAAGTLALPLPDPGSERAQAIDDFVAPGLNHARATTTLPAHETSPWARALTRAFAQPGALDAADARDVFDRVRHELQAADPLYAPQDRHWRDEFLRLQGETDNAIAGMRQAIDEYERLRDALPPGLVDGTATERLDQRLASLESHAESTRVATERLLTEQARTLALEERIGSIETDARERQDAEQRRFEAEREALIRREAAALHANESLEASLRQARDAERDRRAELEALRGELQAARGELGDALDEGHEASREVTALREELALLGTHLENTRNDLESHRHVLGNLMNSRSWKLTRPLRAATALFGRGRVDPFDPALRHPVPWHELLPGRPFRQRFRSPLPELAGLGIVFFAYGRANTTSVRVRLFEERRAPRAPRLIEEALLTGDEIRDGETSRVAFTRKLRGANELRLLLEIESIDGAPGATVTPALGQPTYPGRILSRDLKGEPKSKGLLVLEMLERIVEPRKAIGFVSGCPGGAYRYRCEHPAEMFRLRGYAVDVLPADTFPWKTLLEAYQIVIAHRVPYTPEFEDFLEAAAERGVRVFFDTDDLVFAPEIADQIAALDDLSRDERALWLDGVERYRKSLELCSHALVSTPGLAQSLESRLEIETTVMRNRVTTEMVEAAEAARRRGPRRDRFVRIGYMSGTATHQRDFAECAPALASLLGRHPNVRLTLVGHIEIPEVLEPHEARIDRVPLVPWQALPELYAEMDISLAPLERDNEFTRGKSELKYFEAGLVGIPTVASRVGSYIDAIRDGVTGYLCDDEASWTAALEGLVTDRDLRTRIGQAAHDDALARYTTRAAASETAERLLGALGARTTDTLSVAMVVRAPIANTGGGYKKVFHLVEHLASAGHQVTVYVERIAHLEDLDDDEIEAFCREHFDCGDARIVVGHNAIDDCDVAIATNWPTAHVVNDCENARLRLYFLQDDEAEFYAIGDPNREAAAATYRLPLLMVGIGRYLPRLIGARNQQEYPHIDFALGAEFFEAADEVRAKLARLPEIDAPSLLFFARPGIPRRAFELGVEALTRFQKARPDVTIRLYGLDEPMELPFEYEDLGVVDQQRVAAEMRRADVHLSFSRTNASTVIFEAMACGAVAVELDVESVRALIEDPASCVLCEDSPTAVASALVDLFEDPDRMARIARSGQASVASFTVENMCRQFEDILLRHSLGGRR